LPADNPYASQIENIARGSGGESLEDFLDESGTTAFLVVHDDKLLYERYSNSYDEPPSPAYSWGSPQLPWSQR